MKDQDVVVHRDPDILGGTPVFVGTRVPVKALLDYLAGGHTLDDFLDDFPTVTRVQAVAVLEQGIAVAGRFPCACCLMSVSCGSSDASCPATT